VPPSVGKYAESEPARAQHPGVVYALAPSYVSESVLWAGSDDGLVHVTVDGGKTWKDVTPPDLRARPWAKISLIDASHSDARTAYVAVNTLSPRRPPAAHLPHARRRRNVAGDRRGIDSGAIVNAVREDPSARGCSSPERAQVWVSFDDGDHWQSLRLNMPATSIRDLVIKDDDLVVGTHGRSFWILDDITPLRQVDARTPRATWCSSARRTATRWRWNVNTDTPVPPDEPQGENPPDGAS
jgi:hypothetical protein